VQHRVCVEERVRLRKVCAAQAVCRGASAAEEGVCSTGWGMQSRAVHAAARPCSDCHGFENFITVLLVLIVTVLKTSLPCCLCAIMHHPEERSTKRHLPCAPARCRGLSGALMVGLRLALAATPVHAHVHCTGGAAAWAG